jgi:hypothetical protein
MWRQVPDRRSVTYRRRTATTPTYQNYTIANCWYRPDETHEGQPTQGVYVKRYRRWYLPKEMATAGGFTADPLPADLVVNTTSGIDPVSGSWTVLSQTEVGALGCWQLSCVLLEVRSAFAVTVTVQRRVGTKDTTARILPTTSNAAAITGWFQTSGAATEQSLLDKTQLPTKGTIYFQTYVSGLLATDTLNVSGTSYNVMSMADPQSLEELQSAEVELAR